MASLCVCLGLVSLSDAYVNIALNQPTHQLNQYNPSDSRFDASNAVDGLKSDFSANGGQCVISGNNKQIATWWVNLTSILSIHHITIYYRTDNVAWDINNGFTARFLGFSVYVSNSTIRTDGELCFNETSFNRTTVPNILNITCIVHGQYVIYYNERLPNKIYPIYYSSYAHNELCEVEVHGCPTPGYFGLNCSIPCADVNCQYCHIETGTCQGCKPGYQGHRCEQACSAGYFGKICAGKCNTTCKGCNNVNGLCEYGCHSGWKGVYCEAPCNNGTYGDNCSKTCGKCRHAVQCHHIDGICNNGCESGYQGDKCDAGCNNNGYGENCGTPCGNCLDAVQCHHINGTCMNGCDSGYQGVNCNQECDDNFFGINCKQQCNQNCYGCNKKTGACDTGCKPGWKGMSCQEECMHGFHGKHCNTTCGKCFNRTPCHHISGICDQGCEPGFEGLTCINACSQNMYGVNCSKSCGHCFNSEPCHNINGTCMEGCDSGYNGSKCTEECDDERFGRNCREMCNATCKSCNKSTGICDNGCNPGWKGLFCEEKCIAGFYGENCNNNCGHCLKKTACHHINGMCDEECEPGYKVPYCTEECSEGNYGINCNESCGYCSNISHCSHVNGTCHSGCSPGYRHHLCKEVCSEGQFGQNCALKCNTTCQGCNNVNGVCDTGCITGWKGVYCHEVLPQTSNEGAIIGGSTGVFVILIVLCLIVLTIRRQRNQKSKQKNVDTHFDGNLNSNTEMVVKSNGKDSDMNDSNDFAKLEQTTVNNKEEWSENTIGENDIYMNEQFTPNVPVDQLDSFISVKRSKGNEGFKKEYAALPSGEIRCCDAGKKPENISKNRFKTTFPYDHSRVKLHEDDESSSDYINANYIDGPHRPEEYIAAQGPKTNTLDDFWRMIWQENVSTIVMLTNLKEGDKVKCTQYWPERNKPFSAGPVLVKLIEEKEYAFYRERKMSVSNKQLKKTRVIYQHHYTAWPDHGTPESLCLLTFHHHVISKATNNTNAPTVVHCSAGVGRTGTYIALDALYHTGKQTGKVNVVEFVRKMRESRVSMVQTFEQYITIYLALNNIFKAPVKMDSSIEFCSKAEKAIQDVQETQNEFQLLLKVRPTYTGVDYKMAKQNSARNCIDTILPLDKYSLFLSSSVINRGNYINAIFVPSFTNARRFIVTKYPTPDGAVDFLRLLNDHESDTVICMDPVQNSESIRSWLPDASSSTVVTPFTVHCQSKSKTDVICHLIDILQEKNEDESHSVVVVEPRARIGPNQNSQDTSHLRSLVSAALLSETENPTTVVCSDGASLCGVFIAVHNVIQQLDKDGGVDLFTTVRQLQVRRPEFCANFDEYQMVYRALYDHIQSTSENIYFNQ